MNSLLIFIAVAILQALLVLLIAPFVSGLSRVIRAKMHTRKGPSIFQDYRDIAKLFKRQDVRTKDSSFIHRFMPVLYLGVMLLLACGIPMFLQTSPISIFGDIFLILYLLAAVRFFFSLVSIDNGDSYAGVGGARELILGILVEPGMMLTLFVLAILIGTTNVGVMSFYLPDVFLQTPATIICACLAFGLACYVELGKLPYDFAEAEQEIQEGPLQEYSGASLGILKIAMPMRQIIFASWFAAIFIPFGAAAELSIGAIALGFLFYLLKVLIIFVVCAIIENLVSRVRFKIAGRQIWAILGLAILSLAFCLMGI